jgi:predicted ArsR family transcriptional regulator
MDLLSSRGFKSSTRLAIMIYLLARRKAFFTDLLNIFNITPGNLWSHLEKLRNEGLIEIKYAISGRPKTLIVITEEGYKRTLELLQTLLSLIDEIEKE